MTNRRTFLKRAGLAGAGAVGTSTLAAPYVKAQAPIKWRLQTYAGSPLAPYVIQPAVEAFNKAANGEMVIELYTADQLVPQGELFRAVQNGTIDAAQSDDDSMGSPADVAIFGAYFPFATLFSLVIEHAAESDQPLEGIEPLMRLLEAMPAELRNRVVSVADEKLIDETVRRTRMVSMGPQSLLLKGGVPVHVVSARAGHAKASTTLDTYSHLLGDEDAGAAVKAEEMLQRILK